MATLCIAYAVNSCTEEGVRDVFTQLGAEIIGINTLTKSNTTNGQPFKMFFIEFASNDILTELIADIDADPAEEHKRHTRVQYNASGHYWKVSKARKAEKKEEPFKPTILKRA